MRVLCIDDNILDPEMYIIPIGEVVTVVGKCPYYPDSYLIKEYPVAKDGVGCSYHECHFAPLSEIDEKSFERNYKTEKI